MQVYAARSEAKAAAARAKWREAKASGRSKKAADSILKKAGIWGEEPGFVGNESVLIDSGYKLFTPDSLHGLGRIMLDFLAIFIVCLSKTRGSLTAFSNRIKGQERFRPQGRQAFHVFLAVGGALAFGSCAHTCSSFLLFLLVVALYVPAPSGLRR